MKKALLYLWQLPQNLLGLLVILAARARYDDGEGAWLTKMKIGVSLGNYIIVYAGAGPDSFAHERGRQRQSLYLGPLYLIIIGLPSLIGNLVRRIVPFDYYKQPWEAWADRLGGVRRK